MDSMGQQFRAAREKKKMNISKAAALTRIKIQHLEMMENDDFSKMPAPTYAKGFIRIYASFLGLDPAPLVQEYVDTHLNPSDAGSGKPSRPAPPIRREPVILAPEPVPEADEPAPTPRRERTRTPWTPPWKKLAIGATLGRAAKVVLPLIPRLITAAVAVLLLVGIIRCSVKMAADTDPDRAKPSEMDRTAIMKEPPVRYLNLPAPEEPTP
jgi:cytoskeleton protein RodZ